MTTIKIQTQDFELTPQSIEKMEQDLDLLNLAVHATIFKHEHSCVRYASGAWNRLIKRLHSEYNVDVEADFDCESPKVAATIFSKRRFIAWGSDFPIALCKASLYMWLDLNS